MDFKRTLKQQSALARLPQIAIFLFRIIYSTMWYSIYQCIIQCCLTFQAPKHSSKNEWGMRFVFCLTSKQLSAFSLLHSKCAKKIECSIKIQTFFNNIFSIRYLCMHTNSSTIFSKKNAVLINQTRNIGNTGVFFLNFVLNYQNNIFEKKII